MSSKKKPLPGFATDEEAERFVAESDLTEYDFSGFRPMHHEFQPKDANISMRVPQTLLREVKEVAAKDGIPYQRFVRQVLQEALAARRKKAS